MRFTFTPEQERWRHEVREFIAANMSDELRAEMHVTERTHERGPLEAAFERKLADMRWNGLLWPREYGGLERTAIEMFIMIEELEYHEAPRIDVTVTSLGPIIMRHGTPANKEMWLPKIISGEVVCALGYSEPDAGTDLASLSTKAVLDGDQWIVNGQKTWNTNARRATHEWLAVRTDPTVAKHKGISVLMVPIDSPGIEIRAIQTWGDQATNEVFLDDVAVPAANLIGEVNHGWDYMRGALVLERGGIGRTGALRRLFDQMVQYAKSTVVDGQLLFERPDVRSGLAEFAIEIQVIRMFFYSTAALVDIGEIPVKEATMSKVGLTELRARMTGWAMRMMGMHGQLNRADALAPFGGAHEVTYRRSPIQRFGGGTNEVMRDIIAQQGYGLPRSR